MLKTHAEAESLYGSLRREALGMAAQVSPSGRRFTEIDAIALSAAKAWGAAADRHVTWNWEVFRSAFRRRYPKRFEVAVWDEQALLALSLGRPTYAGIHLRLDLVEARPISAGNRGKVLPEILIAYGIYARLLGAQTIRIMNPINDEVQAYYEGNGYRYVSKGDYLFKEIV